MYWLVREYAIWCAGDVTQYRMRTYYGAAGRTHDRNAGKRSCRQNSVSCDLLTTPLFAKSPCENKDYHPLLLWYAELRSHRSGWNNVGRLDNIIALSRVWLITVVLINWIIFFDLCSFISRIHYTFIILWFSEVIIIQNLT